MKKSLVAMMLSVCILVSFVHAQDEEPGDKEAKQKKLEAAFAKKMSGVVMTGVFTIKGQKLDNLREEKYTITKVQKLKGEFWAFHSRLQYGDKDITLPIAVPMKWAGDTPMISITNMAIPGLGAGFSARVLFHEDFYAGTWRHGEHSGHMFGTISKIKKEPEAPGKKSDESN